MDGKQIGDILETSRNLHSNLLQAIRQQARRQKDELFSTALTYLDEVEQKAHGVIDNALTNQPQKLLDTFIRYYPDDLEDEARRLVDDCPGKDTVGLMHIMIGVRQQLVGIYDFCTSDAHLPDVADLMANIREFEHRQLLSLGQQMNDYPFEQVVQDSI